MVIKANTPLRHNMSIPMFSLKQTSGKDALGSRKQKMFLYVDRKRIHTKTKVILIIQLFLKNMNSKLLLKIMRTPRLSIIKIRVLIIKTLQRLDIRIIEKTHIRANNLISIEERALQHYPIVPPTCVKPFFRSLAIGCAPGTP